MRIRTSKTRLIASCVLLVVTALTPSCVMAQATSETNPLRDQDSTSPGLTTKQSRLADRYDQLEMLAARLAELSRATQPRRARLLRELVSKSREQDISGRFNKIVAALEVESLGKASTSQGELQVELQKLLDLLLQEDRDKQIESERKRIRKYLAELKKLIQRQRGIKARTDGGDEANQLKDDQKNLSDSTDNLEQEITANEIEPQESESSEQEPSSEQKSDSNSAKPTDGKSSDETPDAQKNNEQKPNDASDESEKNSSDQKQTESPSSADNQNEQSKPSDPSQSQGQPSQGKSSQGQPSEGQPSEKQGQPQSDEQADEPSEQSQSPAERAQQRLKRAQQRMQQALDQLEEANRDAAVDRQEKAIRELELAKAELERILRQLREEELERTLVLLEARFRKMLDAQIIVYEQTKKMDGSRSSVPEHEIEIASGRLSRQERAIVREADRALVLLREDGTTVAFPEAIEQAREDMQSVEKRLGEIKTGLITQGLEEDIIAALEETLAALQQALKKARAQKGKPQQSSGSSDDQDLVDQLAELRMIRALQNRINRRTQRYGEIIGDQPTADPDLLEALDELSQRQERIFQATRDLDSGRNK